VTKLQIPVMYAIFILDFKILKWETKENTENQGLVTHPSTAAD
jgi:hypothetical protein